MRIISGMDIHQVLNHDTHVIMYHQDNNFFFLFLGRGSVNREQSEDYPNELGSTHSLNREDGVELTAAGDYPLGADQHWEMNYHEAAIFLEVR